MHQKSIFIVASLLLFFASCTTQNKSEEITKSVDVPKLLDRPEALWQDIEWDNLQRAYVKNQQKWSADIKDGEAGLALAAIFINEARITGEHGHYYPAALQVLTTLLEQADLNVDIQFRALSNKAGVLLSLHQFQEALEVGQKAVGLNPYNAHIHGVLVDAYVEMGDYPKAVAMADKMVSLRPDLRSYARVSYLREIHGDIEGAIAAMEQAVIAGYPGYEQTAWARLTLGDLYKTYGKPEKAKIQYETALAERPNYPFAIAALAELDMDAENYADAEKKLKEAIEIIPEVGFYHELALLYKATNQMEAYKNIAEAIFPMLEDDVANGHQMNMEYAQLYLELFEDLDKALDYALIEYQDRPMNIDVNRLLASIYAKQGNTTKVKEHLKLASSTQSQHPELKELQAQLALK